MGNIKVFLSSSMTGELDTERACVKTQFNNNPDLLGYYQLLHFQSNARPVRTKAAYLDDVKKSHLMLLILFNELREPVVQEYNTAIKHNIKILCYIKDSSNRSKEMNNFIKYIQDQQYPVYLPFRDSEDLIKHILDDLKKDLLDTYHTQSFYSDNTDFVSIPEFHQTQYRLFTLEEIKKASIDPSISNLTSDQLMERSLYLIYEQFRYRDALMLLEVLILKDPTNWMAYNNKGLYLSMMGFDDAALLAHRKSVLIKPHASTYLNIGNILFNKHRIPEAIEAFKESLELDTNKETSINNLVNSYIKLAEYDTALQYSNRVISTTKDPYLIANHAQCLIMMGQPDEALPFMESLDKNSYVCKRLMVIFYLNKSNHELVLKQINEMIEIGQAEFDMLIIKFQSLLALKQFDKAMDFLKTLEEDYPFDAETYNNIGWALIDKYKLFKLAIPLFEKAIVNNPYLVHAWVNLEFCYMSIKEYDRAISVCDKAIKANPFDSGSVKNKQAILVMQGKVEEAMKFGFASQQRIGKNDVTDEEINKSYANALKLFGISEEEYKSLFKTIADLIKLKEDIEKNIN